MTEQEGIKKNPEPAKFLRRAGRPQPQCGTITLQASPDRP